jgi:wyosine [tRNA(Phe)-imidazoG37] synthetase (radical SAM superfamily)
MPILLKNTPLSVLDHSRDSAHLTYVYPVISRRAGGVSVGINLNPNNACNWRCIYCQVPNLTRGTAPPINFPLLEQELQGFLYELLHGDFMQNRVPEGMRRINDIALSGNGEPTSCAEFAEVIALIAKVRAAVGMPHAVKTVLISNGSLMHRDVVQSGVREMAKHNGEVWFKLDRASSAGMLRVNDTHSTPDKVYGHLSMAIALCPTWLQTCWFAVDGEPPSVQDEQDYLNFLARLLADANKPQGVLLYGLARQSLQAEAARLSALPRAQLDSFAQRIRELGLAVKVSD